MVVFQTQSLSIKELSITFPLQRHKRFEPCVMTIQIPLLEMREFTCLYLQGAGEWGMAIYSSSSNVFK